MLKMASLSISLSRVKIVDKCWNVRPDLARFLVLTPLSVLSHFLI